MSLPDPLYIAQPTPQQYLVNKTNGGPLAAGIIEYYQDIARTIPKSVYIQQRQPDNSYVFVDIGNEITLSNVGTPQYLGSDFIPYLWPYDGTPGNSNGTIDLYFVQIYSSDLVLQETRDAWPPNVQGSTNPIDLFEGSDNAISNPQFVKVLFAPDIGASTFALSVSGTNTETEIAPGWSLITTGTDTITLQQLDISDANIDSNPPYALAIQSGASITSMKLRQKFNETPRLFANGFVNGSVLAASTGSVALSLTLTYTQSNGSSFPIVTDSTTANNLYSTIQGTVEIMPVTSSDAAPTGYSTLDITLPLGSLIKLTSAQLVTVQNANSSTEFLQESVDRQVDHLFHYYKPQLEFKPISSYLVGWDFPLNPAQLGSSVAAKAVGANKSYYAWDQTILFQTANSGITTSRHSDTNGLLLTAAATGQIGVIQYLGEGQAKSILLAARNGLSVNIRMSSTAVQNLTVSLWWHDTSAITGMSSNNSLVTGLGTNGYPTVSAGWTEIGRGSLGKAIFTTSTSTTDYKFNGFIDSSAYLTGGYIAIVIGSNSVSSANALLINSVSLVPGDIATIPAPQTSDQVLRECQYYYEYSYALPTTTTPVGATTTVNLQSQMMNCFTNTGTSVADAFSSPFEVLYAVLKRTTPTFLVYTSTGTANTVASILYYYSTAPAFASAGSTPALASYWAVRDTGTRGITYIPITNSTINHVTDSNVASNYCSSFIEFHWTADSRLGVI